MVTIAEKAVTVTVVLVIDVAMLAVGGAVFAAVAGLVSLPFIVSVLSK